MTTTEPLIPTEEVPLSRAKSALFELVAQVETRGGEVVLTRHGRAVAKLVPVSEPRRKQVDFGCMKDLVKAAPAEAFEITQEEWGELADEEGKPYGGA